MSAPDRHLLSAPELGLIRVSGPDARAFLNAQLSQRIDELDERTARFAAWLDPQGRVLACFDIVATRDGIDLITMAELVEAMAGRLRLYVLRARVRIDVPAQAALAALPGDTGAWLRSEGIALGDDAGSRASADGVEWFRVGPGLAYTYPQPAATGGDDDAVEIAEIRLGRPRIGRALSGQFTAHMLNLHELGAVAFDKGCYPGQEVVARTQNLGAAKRRLFGLRSPAGPVPMPGDEVSNSEGASVGTVVRAAQAGNGSELLAVVQREAIDGALTVGSNATPLERHPVPGEPGD